MRKDPYEAWANFINNAYPKGNQQVTDKATNPTSPTVNQDIVSSNIRGLQSRTNARGKKLAQAEVTRTTLKRINRDLRFIGLPVPIEVLIGLDEVNEDIRFGAKDQTLDRQLLKQQYVLQALPRPAKVKVVKKDTRLLMGFKPGDIVQILVGDGHYYQKNLKAKLLEFDYSIRSWEASFRDLGNPPGSFDDILDGAWFIGDGKQGNFAKI